MLRHPEQLVDCDGNEGQKTSQRAEQEKLRNLYEDVEVCNLKEFHDKPKTIYNPFVQKPSSLCEKRDDMEEGHAKVWVAQERWKDVDEGLKVSNKDVDRV